MLHIHNWLSHYKNLLSYHQEQLMQRVHFNFERLSCFLIMIDFYLNTDQLPKSQHIGMLLVVFFFGLYRDGADLKTIFLILAIIADLLYAQTGFRYFYIGAVVLCFLNLLYPLKLYWLPRVPDFVGYRKLILPEKYGSLDAAIFFPAAENNKKQTVSWLLPNTLDRMYESDQSDVIRIPKFLYKFFMSYMKRYKLRFSKSNVKPDIIEAIVFSHGLSGNIHMYSTLLSNLAMNRIVITVQHTQKSSYGRVSKEEREVEILSRVKDMINAYDFVNDEKEMKSLLGAQWKKPKNMILMGHSYGGATSIETAYTIKDRLVKCIVALDPWLFALKQQRLKDKIPVKIVSIETERFTLDKLLDGYNNEFWETNQSKEIRLNLKYADHLHQCDMGFIIGSTLNVIQKPQKTAQMHMVCLKIARTFIDGVEQNKPLEEIRKEIKNKCGFIFKEDFESLANKEKKQKAQ